jgi:hypothetical protein
MTMLRNRIGAGVMIGGAMLLLAACSGGGTASSGDPDVPTIPQSTTQQATTATPSPSAPATSTAQAEQPPPSVGGGAQPASTECKVADLKLSLGGGDSAAGTTYRSVVFTNKGTRTCTMQGFPGVSYVAGDDGHQVGPAAFRSGEKGPVVTLKPGGTAFADVGFVRVENFEAADCKPTAVRGLRIYPPHDYDSLFLPNTGTGCAGTPPGNQLTVATVRSGSGGGA